MQKTDCICNLNIYVYIFVRGSTAYFNLCATLHIFSVYAWVFSVSFFCFSSPPKNIPEGLCSVALYVHVYTYYPVRAWSVFPPHALCSWDWLQINTDFDRVKEFTKEE